jgi:hypothetical protein
MLPFTLAGTSPATAAHTMRFVVARRVGPLNAFRHCTYGQFITCEHDAFVSGSAR